MASDNDEPHPPAEAPRQPQPRPLGYAPPVAPRPPTDAPSSKLKFMLEGVVAACALIAIVISALTIHFSSTAQADVSESTLIKDQYSSFDELNRLQHDDVKMSHLYSLPKNYDAVKKLVAVATSSATDASPAGRAELLLKERAFALEVFTIYENTLYQQRQALIAGDVDRSKFLGEVLEYLTGRLLRNPRLQYYWAETGTGLSGFFEETTKTHYAQHVLNGGELLPADPRGPFSD